MSIVSYDLQPGSGSVDGKMVAVAETTSPGTILHTATSDPTEVDVITILVANIDNKDKELTIEWGGLTDADKIIIGIPHEEGLVLIINGRPLKNGQVVRAFSNEANKINVLVSYIRRTVT